MGYIYAVCVRRVLKLVYDRIPMMEEGDALCVERIRTRTRNAMFRHAAHSNRIGDEQVNWGWRCELQSPSSSSSSCSLEQIKRFKLYEIVLSMKSIDCMRVCVCVS